MMPIAGNTSTKNTTAAVVGVVVGVAVVVVIIVVVVVVVVVVNKASPAPQRPTGFKFGDKTTENPS